MPWAFAPIGAFAALAVFAYAAPLAPLAVRAGAPGTAVLDANGAIIARDAGEGLRIPVPLEDVAPAMVAATIAAEDRRFFVHPGFDPLAMARAAVTLRTSPSGASTITQQLARRLYIDGDPPLALRKARELLVAVRLEARYSKHELLAAYLNDVYYGRGAYGVEAAARVYFGVPAAALTLAQASYLAGLPQLPAHYAAPDAGAPAR
ncbi:MAG: biosynthetic peptidoglycan transglycosylase, partial [Dehalococcoidia bacterium]